MENKVSKEKPNAVEGIPLRESFKIIIDPKTNRITSTFWNIESPKHFNCRCIISKYH